MSERRRKTDFEAPSQRELDTNHTKLFEILHEIRDRQVDNAVSLGKVETHVENLAGPQGRVTALESSHRRQWWVTVAIAPALALAHGIARKLGVQI